MSVKRTTMKYGAAAAALAIAIIAASAFFVNSYAPTSTGTAAGTSTSLLVIQLTDPPQVPAGTTALNMTYSSLALLVGEPAGNGQVTTNTVQVTPPTGTATLNLLRLQNVSQTIGTANVPTGSVVYSITFTVTQVKINVSGTVSTVTLASGGTFTVTMAGHDSLQGTNTALLQLNPVVVSTPSGYSMIPSSVGVIRASQGQGEQGFGSQHQLTNGDNHDLQSARGNVTANLTALSVNNGATTVTVQVNNTGTVSFVLNGIGMHGNFTENTACQSQSSTTTTTTTSTTSESQDVVTNDHTTFTVTQSGFGGQGFDHSQQCGAHEHPDQVVFVPVAPASSPPSTTTTTTTSTTSNSCVSMQMALVNGDSHGPDQRGLTLSPGECVNLTFSGVISFGQSSLTLVPSTTSGQSYQVHVIASNGAEMSLNCVLPLGASSCTVANGQNSNDQ